MARSREKQTRLAFTPLPSSSPAAKGYNKQIQDRAATVVIDSPAKRRKIQNNDEKGEDASEAFPTPSASRDRNDTLQDSGTDSEPVRATQRSAQQPTKRAARNRQQRIDFSSARDPDTFSSPLRLASSPSRAPASSGPGMFNSQRRRRVVNESESDEQDDELPEAQELMHKAKNRRDRKQNENTGRRTRSSQPTNVRSDDENEEVLAGNHSSNAIEIDSAEDDDDEDMPTTIGTQRRKRQRQRRGSINSFIDSSPPQMPDSETEIESVVERSRKRRRQDESENDEEEQEQDHVTPRRKRQMSRREKEELAEDLEDLKSSQFDEEGDEADEAGVRPPGTQSSQKTAKGLALERLKRRREGKISNVEIISEEEEDGEEVQLPMSSAKLLHEDDYDKEFIDEEGEEDDILGIPQGIPLKFTRYASMKPKELFKFAVDWMVQKRMNPGFQMRDEIYEMTFRKLDDETKGLVGSKFVSSAWTPEFASALKARPEIAFEPLDRHLEEHWMRDKCDACNRSGHPATYQIQFQGTPYHLDTLEEVGANDDDDDDTDSNDSDPHNADNEPAYDSLGNEIVPAVHTFYVGKFCMSNAQTAHALQHWRYHLNVYVETWLVQQKYDTPEAFHKLNKLSIRKRGKKAGKIVKRMEEEGIVKDLWHDFKQNIEEARNAKQGGRFS